ncbi:MAG TPA: anthranilate synthase component I [Candidatus Acidoferrales bacterium]|nr:anthranilate synthase component I [Candidatus Acidoferrales bacterium]
MIQPDFKTFSRLAREGNLVPVYEIVPADLLTPVSAFFRMAHDARYACMLESIEGGEKIARHTFIGVDPAEVFRFRDGNCILESGAHTRVEAAQPMEFLRELVKRYETVRVPGLPPLVGGAIGYLAYDMVRQFERLPDSGKRDVSIDDAVMMFFLGLVAFDHVQHRIFIIRNVFTGAAGSLRAKYAAAVREIAKTRRRLAGISAAETAQPKSARRAARPPKWKSNFTRPAFLKAVRKCKEYIRAGDAFQIVLSQRFSARVGADPFEIYRQLRVINPSPYMYFLKLGDVTIAGSSPEMLVKVQGREAFYHPIAGTAPRGVTEKEDQLAEAKLLADPKERAEHVMLVDLGRNDLGRVSEYGSVKVARLMYVERYSHVMHLVSSLRSTLRPDVDCFDALAACFPAGTLSGAPKIRAMEIIDELEPTRRGIYGGAILYLDFAGNLDSCIAIRTLLMKDGVAYVQAGGGLVADSVPAREYQESVNKAKAVVRAIELASRLSN